ncbi:MAG: hypothetical protein QOI64_1421 [Solirubrobacteraceae bacterium]|nr:hypothetical protein [Solirubrobacteraceae bacterium]
MDLGLPYKTFALGRRKVVAGYSGVASSTSVPNGSRT